MFELLLAENKRKEVMLTDMLGRLMSTLTPISVISMIKGSFHVMPDLSGLIK